MFAGAVERGSLDPWEEAPGRGFPSEAPAGWVRVRLTRAG